MAEWFFPEQRALFKQRDPIQGEFFATASIDSVADSIVRESVQNSLDACAEGRSVSVRFLVGETAKSEVEPLLRGLWPHVRACDETAADLDGQGTVRFLVVEDFGTTGLRGDPTEMFGANDGDHPNEFYYFVRAEGQSSKSGADRGSWGIGKYTYPMASQINAVFVVTVRQSDAEPGGTGPLVIGQAVLRGHVVDGSHYVPDGWWAEIEDDEPLPFSAGSEWPTKLMTAFNVARSTEPGLSVVVPFVSGELDSTHLIKSVVRNYGVAITWGLLTALVVGEDGIENNITADSIDEVIDRLPESDSSGLSAELQLAKWGMELDDSERVTLGQPPERPSWGADGLMDREQSKVIRDALDSGTRLAVRVPVSVGLQADGQGKPVSSFADVYFAATDEKRTTPGFYREGLRISEVQSPTIQELRALVVINDEPLAEMLGLSEGPAHVDWSAQTERFRGKYIDGKNWIGYVKKAPSEILRLARSDEEEEDRKLAAEFFSIEIEPPEPPPPDPEPSDPGKDGGDGEIPPPPPPPPPKPPAYRINKLEGGFSTTVSDRTDRGQILTIRVAYDVRKGNALSSWTENDFRLEDLPPVEVTGGTLIERAGNQIRARIADAPTFNLRVRGFDPNRDLFATAEIEDQS